MVLCARSLSLLFHPLMVGVWMALLVMYGYASAMKFPHSIREFVIGSMLAITVAAPLLFRKLLSLSERLGRLRNSGRMFRCLTLVFDAICLVGCGWLFSALPLLFLVRKMLYLLTIATLVVLIVEFWRPLSRHLVSYGVVLGYMWVLLFVGNISLLYPFVVALVGGGLLLSSRLYLTSQRPSVLYLSLIVGVLISLFGAFFV